ncbi:MAG: hypothetical protein HY558_03430 [Euryarchaeota archaeon]|nr:hypothetical protein [Euryarchaeota archaeon]
MAAELGKFLAMKYNDESAIKEVLEKVPQPIRDKVGEALGDHFLQASREQVAFTAYAASGAYKKLLGVGDKALEKGNIALAKKSYRMAEEHKAIDRERKDVYDFLCTVIAPEPGAEPAKKKEEKTSAADILGF